LPDIVQFVDRIDANPIVWLDLNDDVKWSLDYEGTDFSPPALNSAYAGTLLVDGERQAASAKGNRRLKLALDLIGASVDDVAVELQKLHRELDRPANFLRWQPTSATNPVFFRTIRSAGNKIVDYPGSGKLRTVDVEVEADPFAYGLKETLAPIVVTNNSSEGATLNVNPFFETDASGWFVNSGEGAIVRSTAQAHEGAASLLLTPDGVGTQAAARSVAVTGILPGMVLRASAWLRCAVARTVRLRIDWRDSGGTLLSTSNLDIAVSAATWTFFDMTGTAPASTAQAGITAVMTGTPPASNTLHIDEARLLVPGSPPNMCFDVTGVKGDYETPLDMVVAGSAIPATGRRTLFAVRRRGTPSNLTQVSQIEGWTLGTDTTLQANDTNMSGPGSNFLRCTFANANLVERASISGFPTTSSDSRGRYRAFARIRRSSATGAMTMQLSTSQNGIVIAGPVVTLPLTTTIRWVDLGYFSVPFGYDPVDDGAGVVLGVASQRWAISAARASGTSTLDFDALMLMPADDSTLTVYWGDTGSGAPADYVVSSAKRQVFSRDGSGNVQSRMVEVSGCGYPMVSPGVTNRVYVMLSFGAQDSKTDTLTIIGSYFPRYGYVRPAIT
jgi:hypothetical protein